VLVLSNRDMLAWDKTVLEDRDPMVADIYQVLGQP
jgi:hypothetical protein